MRHSLFDIKILESHVYAPNIAHNVYCVYDFYVGFAFLSPFPIYGSAQSDQSLRCALNG